MTFPALPGYLLDVNALIALGVCQHQFHVRVATWVETRQFASLLTCPTTELGFIRILGQRPEQSGRFTRTENQNAGLLKTRSGAAALRSDDGGCNNHSDEGKNNQNIMHGSNLLCESSSELVHTLIIGRIREFLNPTKTALVTKTVLPGYPHSCYMIQHHDAREKPLPVPEL